MSWLKYLLLPPTINVVLGVLGLLLWRRMPWLGAIMLVIGVGGLLWLATPTASHWLRSGLEPYPTLTTDKLETAKAIVVLGGGRDYQSPEFGWGDAPNNTTWRRLGYAAHLHRQSGLPLLVTGGRVHGEAKAEATLMALALRESFGLTARWQEAQSRNTAENARYSAAILESEGITRVALVSQAWHLPRAVPAFERAGLSVVPAPTEFASPPPAGWRAWLPRAYHLRHSTQALHEWLGRSVYALRARLFHD
ncbi:YdcF family protein [Halomonas salinarum]|uniref:YdcF family protein n=1 Tax=Halomonas salinarum TaxID=1158993 RepID=UPI00143B94C0|nr:YdcF family protein [Halomonas salinarum]